MKFIEILDEYIEYHKSLCHTEKTIKSYIEILSAFDKVVSLKDYTKLSFDDIKKYQRYLNKKKLSPATVGTYLRHIKAFVNWLENFEYIKKTGLGDKIKIPKQPKKNVKIYSDDEIKLIFKAVTAESEWLTVRNKLIIALMLDSGLRRTEICRIQYRDISFVDNVLNVHGKGRKDRLVPLGNLTLALLKRYLFLCPHSNRMLILTRRGEHMTNNAIKQFFQKLKVKLGFEFSPHRLRHNFATNYLIDQYDKYNCFDAYRLMIIMGHEDMQTMDKYLHYAEQYIATRQRVSHLDKALLENEIF